MLPTWLQSDTGKIITGLLLVFIPIISYTLLFPFYQNCLNIRMVMLIYIAFGAILGAGIAYWFREKPEMLIEKFQLFVAAIIIGMVLIPLLATFINRIFIIEGPTSVNSHIVKVENFKQSRFGELADNMVIDGYFIYTILEEKVVRLNAPPTLDIQEYTPGTNIEVNIYRGVLGLKWVATAFQ